MVGRAVRFNGATVLTNHALGGIPDLFNYKNCGIISYWYRSWENVQGTMFLVAFNGSLILSYQHFAFLGGSNIFPLLRLRSVDSDLNTEAVDFFGQIRLPFDGQWHHVWISWDTANPKQANVELDGNLIPCMIVPPTTVGDVLINYNDSDTWNVGGDQAGGSEYYVGDAAEFYFQPLLGPFITSTQGLGIRVYGSLKGLGGLIQLGGVGWYLRDKKAAMEIGPDGSKALGRVTGPTGSPLVPPVYLSGGRTTFPENRGTPPSFFREFQETGGLEDVTSPPFDPFPVP